MYIFYLGFTARQDYFTHFETSQSVDGAKTGDPREKPPNHPKQNLVCLLSLLVEHFSDNKFSCQLSFFLYTF